MTNADTTSTAEPSHVTFWKAEGRVIARGDLLACQHVADRIGGCVVLTVQQYRALSIKPGASE